MNCTFNTETDYINPITQHVKSIKAMKRDAAKLGNLGIVELCDSQLDIITLMQDDHQRLEKAVAHNLFNVKTPDIREFIDKLN